MLTVTQKIQNSWCCFIRSLFSSEGTNPKTNFPPCFLEMAWRGTAISHVAPTQSPRGLFLPYQQCVLETDWGRLSVLLRESKQCLWRNCVIKITASVNLMFFPLQFLQCYRFTRCGIKPLSVQEVDKIFLCAAREENNVSRVVK